MSLCNKCGQPIEFRFIDGRRIPFHIDGGCSDQHYEPNRIAARHNPESECRKTNCPVCGADVYFIRHNGGSVWIDPPLGPPWERHPCMEDNTQGGVAFDIDDGLAGRLGALNDLITGVVKSARVSMDRKQTILEIAVGMEEPLMVLVRGSANWFVGNLVIVEPDKLHIYRPSESKIYFFILSVLAGPEELIERYKSLYQIMASFTEKQEAHDNNKYGKLSTDQHRILWKYRNHGLNSQWAVHKLLVIIPLIDGSDKGRAIHMAAVRILEQAEKYGDCRGAATLVESVAPAKQQSIIDWFGKYSPIRINLIRIRKRSWIVKDDAGNHRPFDIKTARVTPI